MVLDEVDAANAQMNSNAKTKENPKVERATTASAVVPKEDSRLEQSKQWGGQRRWRRRALTAAS
jgi:hypothetical protein